MAGFDKILKKGKDAVTQTNPNDLWESHIGNILYYLQALNDIYVKENMHHVSIKSMSCVKCGRAGYLAAVRDKNDPSKAINYHLTSWKSIDDKTYECPKCRKG